MAQFNEVKRLIQTGLTDRKIARTLKCRRSFVAEVRKKTATEALILKSKGSSRKTPPGWVSTLNWDGVEKDLREGFQIKRIWEESAEWLTSYSNFFRYVKIHYSGLLSHTVTLREFKAGEFCEVDYAGDKIEWLDLQTGEIHNAHIFVGILCFSQKIFAIAHETEKKRYWLDAHRRMFEFYGGCPSVVVPDCLKNAVTRGHLYDPDLNPDYVNLASHYGIAVVPARPKHPKDKALVENAVGILTRYFKFIYRRRTFTSITEINQALSQCLDQINSKPHSRFKCSRNEQFKLEKEHLKPLPTEPYVFEEWKSAVLHPDCTVSIQDNFYSAPHIYRGETLRVKITENTVEIFKDQERIALHSRYRKRVGKRILIINHLPENSKAYHEATPQMTLAQAKFSHPDLHSLVEELFKQDTLGNLRRAQGLVRKAYSTIQNHDREKAKEWIGQAIVHMRRFNKIRVREFEDQIRRLSKVYKINPDDRSIERKPGNPMLRHLGAVAIGDRPMPQSQLELI